VVHVTFQNTKVIKFRQLFHIVEISMIDFDAGVRNRNRNNRFSLSKVIINIIINTYGVRYYFTLLVFAMWKK